MEAAAGLEPDGPVRLALGLSSCCATTALRVSPAASLASDLRAHQAAQQFDNGWVLSVQALQDPCTHQRAGADPGLSGSSSQLL